MKKYYKVATLSILLLLVGCAGVGAGILTHSFSSIESTQKSLVSAYLELERMGAFVVGKDGEVLGKVKRGSGSDDLGNKFGAGSEHQSDGLFNQFSKFGSSFANTSAFSTFATDPPRIMIKQGSENREIGVLTLNDSLVISATSQRVDPVFLKAWLLRD
jgi:hypothetical protein